MKPWFGIIVRRFHTEGGNIVSQKIKNIFISIGSSKKALYAIMAVVIFAIVIPVLATYTGPNRTKTVKVCENVKVIDGCNYSATVKGLKVYDDPSITPTDHQWPCTISRNVCGNPSASSWKTFCDKSFPGVTWVTSNVLPPVQEIEIFHMEEQCHNETVAAPPATVNGSVSCTNGTNGWCRSDATLNITGSDPNPANTIIAIEGTRNGTDFACASDTCQIDATSNGSFAFEYWAVSSYGDTSYKGNTTITVDKEAPVVGLNLSGSMGYNSWYVSGVSWTTSLTDSVSGPSHAEISVDGTAQSNPGSYAADGSHTIKATGYDNAGNSSQTQQTVQIDQTNPIPTFTLNGSLGTNGWYTSAVNWNATATDATSGVYAIATQLDGASVNNSASIGTNGTHTLQVTAQDNAGNMNSTSGSFKIDQEDPFVSLNLSGTQGTHSWYTGPVSWSSTASDTVSGLATHTATLNGSTTTVNGSVNSDGTYTLIATAQDNASNQSAQTRTFGIDQSAPTVSMNPISGTQNNTVQLSGSSADTTSGVSYVEISIAGQTHQVNTTGAWSYQWNSTSACNGSVTATVRSVDQAGNVSASTTQTFTVENTPTTLTLPAQTDASNPVVFNLNTSNLNQMVIRISDDAGNLPAVTHTFTGTAIPSSYRWDRYMGDGSLAPKGTYTMNVRIYDKNTCTTDTASITLVVTESILSAWVSGAPTNTPMPAQPTATPLPSLTPTIETTATDEAVVALPTETPTSTPTTTPNPSPFVLPKADQKTTTSTSESPKAPDTTPDPDPTTLSTGVLIGTAAAGLIGSIAAYQAAVEAERKRKEAEARKRADELMRQRNQLIKAGVNPYKMNTKQIAQLSAIAKKDSDSQILKIVAEEIERGADPNIPIQDAVNQYIDRQKLIAEINTFYADLDNEANKMNMLMTVDQNTQNFMAEWKNQRKKIIDAVEAVMAITNDTWTKPEYIIDPNEDIILALKDLKYESYMLRALAFQEVKSIFPDGYSLLGIEYFSDKLASGIITLDQINEIVDTYNYDIEFFERLKASHGPLSERAQIYILNENNLQSILKPTIRGLPYYKNGEKIPKDLLPYYIIDQKTLYPYGNPNEYEVSIEAIKNYISLIDNYLGPAKSLFLGIVSKNINFVIDPDGFVRVFGERGTSRILIDILGTRYLDSTIIKKVLKTTEIPMLDGYLTAAVNAYEAFIETPKDMPLEEKVEMFIFNTFVDIALDAGVTLIALGILAIGAFAIEGLAAAGFITAGTSISAGVTISFTGLFTGISTFVLENQGIPETLKYKINNWWDNFQEKYNEKDGLSE